MEEHSDWGSVKREEMAERGGADWSSRTDVIRSILLSTETLSEFETAAKNCEIEVWGRTHTSTKYEAIDPFFWETGGIDRQAYESWLSHKNDGSDPYDGGRTEPKRHASRNVNQYIGIRVLEAQVRRRWPEQSPENAKGQALVELARLRKLGVELRNEAASHRLVFAETRRNIKELSDSMYAQVAKVSPSEAEMLKTLDTLDPSAHPPNVQDKPEVFRFSELLQRVADFTKRHQ